jgi:hypothetical protein
MQFTFLVHICTTNELIILNIQADVAEASLIQLDGVFPSCMQGSRSKRDVPPLYLPVLSSPTESMLQSGISAMYTSLPLESV